MTSWDGWEERQARELEVEVADEWVARQGMRVEAAAAGPSGPWGQMHPVAWAYVTGRLTAGSVPDWRVRFDANPAGVGPALALCVPALGPQGPETIRVEAAAGVYAAGITSTLPQTEATPPRPRGFRNAVDELRATHPGMIESATRGGPPPELFPGSGDRPRATASGIDVAAISGLPWRARLAAAWASDRGEAFRLSQDFGDPDGDESSRLELAGHPAVMRHIADVQSWASTSGLDVQPEVTPDEVAALYPPGQSGGSTP